MGLLHALKHLCPVMHARRFRCCRLGDLPLSTRCCCPTGAARHAMPPVTSSSSAALLLLLQADSYSFAVILWELWAMKRVRSRYYIFRAPHCGMMLHRPQPRTEIMLRYLVRSLRCVVLRGAVLDCGVLCCAVRRRAAGCTRQADVEPAAIRKHSPSIAACSNTAAVRGPRHGRHPGARPGG